MFDFLSKKFSSIFSKLTGQDKLTEKNIDDVLLKVNQALLEADVPYNVVQDFIENVKKEAVGQKIFASLKPSEQFMKIVHDKVVDFLGGAALQVNFAFDIPSIVMVMGLQGAGKTTTIAKLAYYLNDLAQKKGKKRKILFASVDFYRPAAIDQLEILANQAGVIFYRSSKTDPVAAAEDIVKYFHKESCDILFLDTAGRLHVDNNMLKELHSIDLKIKPKYKFLVIDAMTGQESLKVAQAFEDNVGFNGVILTKMDSETRAGLAFAFKYILKKPILFIGSGEKLEDLESFRADRMASRIIGMGDVQSLIEKAQEKIKISDQEAMYNSMAKGNLTLEDFAKQLDMLNNLGPISKLIKYLPGIGSFNLSQDQLDKSEKEMKKFKAIISSMTRKEKLTPKILDDSRKNRIAKGAGVSINEINNMLDRFEQSKQFMKNLKKFDRN